MKKILLFLLLFPAVALAAPPTKPNDFVSGTTIRSDEVDSNFDELYQYVQLGVDTIRADGLDAISEILAALRSGSDQTLVTGTEGSANDLGIWNSDGDLVGTSGLAVWTPATATLGISGNGIITSLKVSDLVSCDTVDTNSDGELICGSDGGGAGSGDAVTVNSSAADTTANFLNGDIDWTLTDGGAGGPDDVTGTVGCTDCVTLATESTGNYVATVADSGNTTVTVSGSGSENAAVTLNVVDVNCTDCLGVTEIADSYVLNTGDTVTGAVTVDGSADAVQLTIQGNATQTSDIFVVENSAGTDIMTANTTGIKLSEGVAITDLVSCDTINTDANGHMFCGTDATGAGSGAFSDAADPAVLNTTTKDVSIGPTQNNTAKLSVDGDDNQVQLSIQGNATQTANLMVVEQSDGTDTWTVNTTGIKFSEGVAISDLASCTSIKTDANGHLSCSNTASGRTSFDLSIYSAKITGPFVVFTPPTADACTQGAQINAGDGNWQLLFDPTTDECSMHQIVIPNNYSSAPLLDIIYSMASATTGTVEFEVAIMCVTPGDSADIGTASFSNVAVATGTVPGTAGHSALLTITITDDSCASGDMAFIVVSKDSNDGTNDTATGDTEIIGLNFRYTGS